MTILPSPIPHPLDLLPWDLPDWAYEGLDWVVGAEWPQGDEKAVWDLADQWYAVAAALAGPRDDAHRAAGEVLAGFGASGAAGTAFGAAWRDLTQGDDAPLPVLQAVSGELGRIVEECGCDIEGAKIEVWIQLGILVVELIALTVVAALTLGAASPAAAAAMAATRLVVQQIFRRLAAQMARKAIREGVREAAERAARDVTGRGLKNFARYATIQGGKEAGEEVAVDLGTQLHQNGTGRRDGLDARSLGMSAVGGFAGGAAAALATLGPHAAGGAARFGESIGRGVAGEVLAEQAASLATGNGLVALDDAGRAATSGATSAGINHATTELDRNLGTRLDALTAARDLPPTADLPAGTALAGDGPAAAGGTLAGDAAGGPAAAGGGDAARQATDGVTGGPVAAGADKGTVPAPTAALPPEPAGFPERTSAVVDATVTDGSLRATGGPDALPSADAVPSADIPPAGVPFAGTVPAGPSLSTDATVHIGVAGHEGPAAEGPTTGKPAGGPTPEGPAPVGAASPTPMVGTAGPSVAAMPTPVGDPPATPPVPAGPVAPVGTVPSPAPAPGAELPVGNPAPTPRTPAAPNPSSAPNPPAAPNPPVPSNPPAESNPPGPAADPSRLSPLYQAILDERERQRYAEYARRERETYEQIRRDDEAARLRAEARESLRRYSDFADEADRLRAAGHVELARVLSATARRENRRSEIRADRADAVLAGRIVPDRHDVADGLDFFRLNHDAGNLFIAPTRADRSALTGSDRPPPVDNTRTYGRRGGLRPPLALHQRELVGRMPRDRDGAVLRTADPRSGGWFQLANDGGPLADPTRSINCLDCTLSFYDTWVHGRPRVSAPRTFDGYAYGNVDFPVDGELDGPGRVEDVTGGRFQQLCPDVSGLPPAVGQARVGAAYGELARQLRAGGHGSYAFLINTWATGASHAWVAINQGGTILFLDPQSGHVSVEEPLYRHCGTGDDGNVTALDVLVLDRDAEPMPLPDHPPGIFNSRPPRTGDEPPLPPPPPPPSPPPPPPPEERPMPPPLADGESPDFNRVYLLESSTTYSRPPPPLNPGAGSGSMLR
ncbi:toxin glutamine deamidase domain-containing protein [Polymorphospora rubra]|uniref:toxin glutamine deamidase domain-containing protein n=1 Tax=Polymorphospora rubra TaxID=338584 RepID=UPI0033CDF627